MLARSLGALTVLSLFFGFADAAEARSSRRGKRGVVQIVCDVQGAKVFFNNKFAGTTPMKPMRLIAKQYAVRIEKDGFAPFAKLVELQAGEKTTLRAKLSAEGTFLEVTARWPGARVEIDGRDEGTIPLRKKVDPGHHSVVVKLPGKKPYKKRVRVAPGAIVVVEAKFRGTPPASDALTLAPIGGGDLDLVAPERGSDDLALVAPSDAPLALVAPDDGVSAKDPIPGSAPSAAIDPSSPGALTLKEDESKAWYEEWWVWTAGGAIVVAGVATAIVLSGRAGDSDSFNADVEKQLNGEAGGMPTP